MWSPHCGPKMKVELHCNPVQPPWLNGQCMRDAVIMYL